MRGAGLQVTLATHVGEDGQNATPIGRAYHAFDQAIAFHARDQATRCTLAQLNCVIEVLDAALEVLPRGDRLENFELTDTNAVPCPQLPFQGLVHDGMPGNKIVPLLDQLPLITSVHAAL